MDPNACFKLFKEAAFINDIDAMREHGIVLRRWLKQGGFIPDGFNLAMFNAIIDRVGIAPLGRQRK